MTLALTWRLVVIASVAAFLSGGASGAWAVHKWYRVALLEQSNRVLNERVRLMRDALGVNSKIDAETFNYEKENQEIDAAITQRAIERRGDDGYCIDADSMRAIGSFR